MANKKKSVKKNKKDIDGDLKSKLKKVVIEKSKNSEKSEEDSNESLENEDFNGINFTEDLRRVLSFKPSSQEVTYVGENLESSVKFAPRVSRGKTEKGMDYSNAKYDANMYNENKYDEKTPDYTSGGGTSAGENSPAEGSSKGNSSQ